MQTASLAALALLAALPATADMRDADRDRMHALDAHLGATLRAGLADGTPKALTALTDTMAGQHDATLLAGLSGDWTCRTIKIGGPAPLIVYGTFRCRIRDLEPGAWRIEKLTGSQRLVGQIALQATLANGPSPAIYTGVGYVDGGPARSYGAFPAQQTPIEPGQTVPQVGLLEMPDANRARILMPAPLLESRFDILSLTR